MPGGRPATSAEEKLAKKFEKIDEGWRSDADSMSTEQLKAKLVEVTRNEAENQEKKENDEALADAKEKYENANFGYKDATAMNKLKIKYLVRNLKDNEL